MIQRFLNNPFDAVDEMLDGVVRAHGHDLERVGAGRALRHRRPDPRRQTMVVVGGGSGHEPAFFGFLGRGLADVAAVGNVFASPSSATIVQGVLATGCDAAFCMVGNYEGDIMNFRLAIELLAEHGVTASMAIMADDVASAAPAHWGNRRAVAGCLFAYKIVGAAADRGATLEQLTSVFETVSSRVRTIGVALGGCRLPTSDVRNFEVEVGTMAIGMGVHGEPGLATGPLEPAERTAALLVDHLIADGMSPGPVALAINLSGATPLMEGYILARGAAEAFESQGFVVVACYVGEFLTSLDMTGASISALSLNDELLDLLDAPADCVAGPNPWSRPQ